ncbi:MAG TPA: hypothetical protein VKX49_14985 [Bryobacteraceae bacterium]|nr:hypothetical protein [Bryobacteraceae bacterium]
MLGLAICSVALGSCYWAGRRSLGQGLTALLFFGYVYGILRANLLDIGSYFVFDAGMIGLYLACLWRGPKDNFAKKRSRVVFGWVFLLVVWPALLIALPFQPLLVSLVGFRGNVFFVPLVLLGSRLKRRDVMELSIGLAVLDLIALGFATAEYFQGVPRYFPMSPVTRIIYASSDAGGGFFRIPASFTSAHAFGGTMVYSIPFLVGLWTNAEKQWQRLLGFAALPAAMLGILMSATRLNFIFGCAMIAFFVFTANVKTKYKFFFSLLVVAMGLTAVTNVRFQRFKSLGDASGVTDRIAGSVNRGFFEILSEYPMGNGLGGGGTSIPYFLESQLRNPIGMENEYARILSEQGVIGLLLWLGFLGWFLLQIRTAFSKSEWATTRRLTWSIAAVNFGTAWIGTGLLTSIPGTVMLMIGAGWTAVPEEQRSALPAVRRVSVTPAPAFRSLGWSKQG